MYQRCSVFHAAVRSAVVYMISQASSFNMPQSLCTVYWLFAANSSASQKVHACKRWDD